MKCKAVRCIYYNAGNGYTVASYVTEETLPKEVSSQKNGRYGMFMAIGNELPTEDGLEVELNGTWKDGKFGMQYKVSSFQIVLPTSTEGIKAYLASDIIKGIGPVLAERIVDRYQENTFEVLEKNPEKLLEIKGITRKKLSEILEGYRGSETLRQLMVISLWGDTKEGGADPGTLWKCSPTHHSEHAISFVRDSWVWISNGGSDCGKSKEF